LYKKYDNETVLLITNTIQRAAIHTCLIFNGYIHRLQGDGVFVYFGNKSTSKEEAVRQALQSTSSFTYFVKNDLKKIFDQQGIGNIGTRIGIDLGHSEDTLWLSAGIGNISEITTCSLHTSLASKMQSSAKTNGIVVGDNIKKFAPGFEEMFSVVSERTEKPEDRYIYRIPEENYFYSQYDLDWLRYLKAQPFITTTTDGLLNLKSKSSGNLTNLKTIANESKPYFK
jgi:class 3 adenylate cyclase